MKRTLLFIMLALVARLGVWAQYEYCTLVVETKSGDTYEVSLRKKPQIKMGVNEISFTCGKETTGYIYDEVRKLYFKPYDPTGITSPTEDKAIRIVHVDQSQVVVAGVADADEVRLYALDGQRIMTAVSTTDGMLTVSLDGLTPGTYILNIGNKQSFKFLRR